MLRALIPITEYADNALIINKEPCTTRILINGLLCIEKEDLAMKIQKSISAPNDCSQLISPEVF